MAPRATILAPTVGAAVRRRAGCHVDAVRLAEPVAGVVQYLYPDTPDYYYQYGDGYAVPGRSRHQPDRCADPAARGRLHAGPVSAAAVHEQLRAELLRAQQLLSAATADYGYGTNLCNRYANGVVYQVDCYTGMVEDVIPTYAGGYGVGQMLPSAYSYYNVPYQYRSMYYDTPDYSYWYAPGAIYQYDPRAA